MKPKSNVSVRTKSGWRHPSPRRASVLRCVVGAMMVIAGAAAIGALVWIGNSHDRLAQRLMFDLGLAGTGLISAGAQVLILIGAWLMWRSWPRGDQKAERSDKQSGDEQA